MPMGRPKVELVLSQDEQSQLASMAHSRAIPAALVTRSRIVLAAATGEPNSEIAKRLQLTRATVGKWRDTATNMPGPSIPILPLYVALHTA